MDIPPGPFGNDRSHRFGVAAQAPTDHAARGVCAGARGRTHDDGRDALPGRRWVHHNLTERADAEQLDWIWWHRSNASRGCE